MNFPKIVLEDELQRLIELISEEFFSEIKFDIIGKVQWNEPTDREKKRYYNKYQKELKNQRVKYTTTHEYQISNSTSENTKWSSRNKLLISEVEDDSIFYCIVDISVGCKSGSVKRYKFNISNYSKTSKISNKSIELVSKITLLIR